MEIAATKDFGNTKNNKIVLPLVPEPTETPTEKEDLATVDLCSDPTNAGSTKVRFAFKTLNGSAESPRDLIDWRKNVECAFTGLDYHRVTSASDDAAVLSRNRVECLQQQCQPQRKGS